MNDLQVMGWSSKWRNPNQIKSASVSLPGTFQFVSQAMLCSVEFQFMYHPLTPARLWRLRESTNPKNPDPSKVATDPCYTGSDSSIEGSKDSSGSNFLGGTDIASENRVPHKQISSNSDFQGLLLLVSGKVNNLGGKEGWINQGLMMGILEDATLLKAKDS